MSQQFKVTLSRYKDGEMRFSTPQWLHVADFDEALTHTNLIVMGLRAADPDSRYEVQGIEARWSGGTQCDGALMFETAAELTARVEGGAKP